MDEKRDSTGRGKRGGYSPGISSAEALLDATAALLQEKGYFGTGLNEILKNSGAPRGSLYHHFPGGKDELVIRALQRSAGQLQLSLQSVAASQGMQAFISFFKDRLLVSNFSKGCPVASVAQEVSTHRPEILEVCSAIYREWENALAEYLGGEASLTRARAILCQLEGAILLAKTHKDISYLDLVLASDTPANQRDK
ncbi:MAG: TetR/AcrR family transcriptional regulator [Leptospiraceae bacterium]|nr:TetR/AcrR family transcriptional regulator [Leptospiraceae bacterium]